MRAQEAQRPGSGENVVYEGRVEHFFQRIAAVQQTFNHEMDSLTASSTLDYPR